MSCREKTKNKSFWGVDRVDLKKEIVFSDKPKDVIFEFTAPSSSHRYDLRFYFTKADAKSNESISKATDEILKKFDGFEYEVVEKVTDKVVIKGTKSYSFGDMEPILYWVTANIELKENKEYLIKLHLPAVEDESEIFEGVYFVVGIVRKTPFEFL